MYDILTGLRVVEGSSFIAGPSAGLYLAQLGAEVIRFDAIGGGPDYTRLPRTAGGHSLYWEGLNKGKKSVALDLRTPEGRELAVALATAPGPEGGICLTNYPAGSFLSHEALAARRPDMITLRVMGWGDGRNAMDNTVNSAVGIPHITGFAHETRPVNHALPAWDLVAGAYAAFALLAAERHRSRTGEGQEVRVPLGDVAIASVANLGMVGEAALSGRDRPRCGNDLFGAFGRDFVTRDGRRLMLVAITARQWTGLVEALGLGEAIAAVEAETGARFASDEEARFRHRARLFELFEAAIASWPYATLVARFDEIGVTWGPYQSVCEALAGDPRFSEANPMLRTIEQASAERYLQPGSAASYGSRERQVPVRAPRLGEHTSEVMMRVLGLPPEEIADLERRGVIASACAAPSAASAPARAPGGAS